MLTLISYVCGKDLSKNELPDQPERNTIRFSRKPSADALRLMTELAAMLRTSRKSRSTILGRIVFRSSLQVFLLVVSSQLMADESRAQQPTEQPGIDKIDWSDPGLICVENALLKTIEATSVASEVSGRIAELDVAEGTVVKSNQAIGKIDDKSVRLQVQRAKLATAVARHKASSQIDLQLAEKRASVAKNELERAETANSRVPNSYPPKELDRLKLVYDTAILEIERAKHEQTLLGLEAALMENDQRLAEELLARHQILSPVNGMIVSLEKNRGEWVEPGMQLFEIVKLDRLRVEGFISASHSSVDLAQRPAVLSLQLADRHLNIPAKLVFVDPEINPVNNEMRVYLEVDNHEGLLSPGMRGKVGIMQLIP